MDKLSKIIERVQTEHSARFVRHAAIFGVVGMGTIVGTYSMAHATAAPQYIGDYTGSHVTNIMVFRPSNGTWYLDALGGSAQGWGVVGDVPVTGDYDGDGKTDIAVWRPSTGAWYWIDSSTGGGWTFTWGEQGDIPTPGDFDGDGKTDFAFWRPYPESGYAAGEWSVVNSSTWTISTTQWGAQGDIPVVGDYDNDGKSDLAVWRPSTGAWYWIDSSTGGGWTFTWGQQGDIPVAGDFDGDGKNDFAFWRQSTGVWWVLYSSTWTYTTIPWGVHGDVPVPGDYDGDGKTDIAVWRPSNGMWFVINSSNGQSWSTTWGSGGPNGGGIGSDIPLPNAPGAKDQLANVLVPQEQSNWCWAATTQMAAANSHVAISQCQEANVNTGRNDCCTDPIAAADTTKCNKAGWWTLTSHGFTETDVWYSAISFGQLQTEFAASRPVPFAWAWTGGGGHAMTAIGTWVTGDGTQWVTKNDPWPPNVGDQVDLLYNVWVSGSDHTHWRDSYNVTKQ
jgi:FG-GAP-like repeat/Papain-like cysteine protease AvrRpt2